MLQRFVRNLQHYSFVSKAKKVYDTSGEERIEENGDDGVPIGSFNPDYKVKEELKEDYFTDDQNKKSMFTSGIDE